MFYCYKRQSLKSQGVSIIGINDFLNIFLADKFTFNIIFFFRNIKRGNWRLNDSFINLDQLPSSIKQDIFKESITITTKMAATYKKLFKKLQQWWWRKNSCNTQSTLLHIILIHFLLCTTFDLTWLACFNHIQSNLTWKLRFQVDLWP